MSTITAQELVTALASLGITVEGFEAPSAPEAKPARTKAEPRYRTAKQIESGHEQERAIYARYRSETGKGFKQMTAKQQAACKAEVRAVWTALKGTRKTAVAK